MSVSYFVRYQGMLPEADRFARDYCDRHGAILKGFPGIRGLTLYQPTPFSDPFPVNPDPTTFLARMDFDSAAALDAALASEARVRARDDFAKFPPIEGPVTHLAMTPEHVF